MMRTKIALCLTLGLLLCSGCRAVSGRLADGTSVDVLVFGVDTHLQGLDATSPSGLHLHLDALDQKDVGTAAALNLASNALTVVAKVVGAPVPVPTPAPISLPSVDATALPADPIERAQLRVGQ